MSPTDPDYIIRLARVADAAGIARAHVLGWRMAYRGVIAGATLDRLSIPERTAMWRERLLTLDVAAPPRGEALFVAVGANGEIAGFARGGAARPLASGKEPAPYDAELYAIYMVPGSERRGVGRRLARAVAWRLASGGRRALLVWALAENPYRGFYETLGGAPVFEQDIVIEGQALPEIGYGWPDIQSLIARVPPDPGDNDVQ
jgi:GNAT superfamily N-acetyltransferase